MSHVTHPSVMAHINELCHIPMSHGTYERVMSHDSTSHVTTGWRRPIGCLKMQVIFSQGATNGRVFLPKMTCKDKASYVSSPPCTNEQVLQGSNESCHVRTSHGTYQRVMSHANESWHI